LVDAAGSFFRGCPLACNFVLPLVSFHERRTLDFLLRLREECKLFKGVEYRALLMLACHLQVTQWQARSSVLTRGAPLAAAFIVLDGKLTGFSDAGGAPSAWFLPGDAVGLEAVLSETRPSPFDVFAARPSLAAVLRKHDLHDMGREFPEYTAQIVQSLYKKVLEELAGPQGYAMTLLAEGAAKVRFAPGDAPAFQQVPRRQPGGLGLQEYQVALRLAESTAPSHWPNGDNQKGDRKAHDDAVMERLMTTSGKAHDDAVIDRLMTTSEKAHDDAVIERLMTTSVKRNGGGKPAIGMPSSWQLGNFLSQKFLDYSERVEFPQSKTPRYYWTRKRNDQPIEGRPVSEPPRLSRHHPELITSAQGVSGGTFHKRSPHTCSGARVIDLKMSEGDPAAPINPDRAGLKLALGRVQHTSRGGQLGSSRLGDQGLNKRRCIRPRSAPAKTTLLSSENLINVYQDAARCPKCATRLPLKLSEQVKHELTGKDNTLRENAPQERHHHLHGKRHTDESDLEQYFNKQRDFMRSFQGASEQRHADVAADQLQAWYMKVISQQTELEKLRARVAELEETHDKLRNDVAFASRERDEWKASALRMTLNREFQATVENLNSEQKRFLRSTCRSTMPDFEASLKQQLKLVETPMVQTSFNTPPSQNIDHRPLPVLRTFPRFKTAGTH